MWGRIAAGALLVAGIVLGGTIPAFANLGQPSAPLNPSAVWADTGVSTQGVECWNDGPSETIYCIQEAGAGATVEACFGEVFSPCSGADFATTENMECVSRWPGGMEARWSGYALCVNSPEMLAYIQSEAAQAPRVGIDFECGADPACKIQQDIAQGVTTMAMGNITEALNVTAFTTNGALWVGAATEFSWWRWAVVLVTVIAAAWGITFGLLKQDGPMVRSAVIGGILAWPLAEVAVWTLGHLLNISEQLTNSVVGRDTGEAFDVQLAELANSGEYDDRMAVVWSSLLLALGSFILVFVFAFRNLALMVLVAFAPLAFMLAPVRPGVRVITVWASAVLALLITKPLTMGLLALILQTGQGFESLWVPEALPLLFGLVLSLFMPFVAFSLFDFVGTQAVGAAEGAGRQVGGSVTRGGQGAVRQVSSGMRSMPRPGGGSGATGTGAGGKSPLSSPSSRPGGSSAGAAGASSPAGKAPTAAPKVPTPTPKAPTAPVKPPIPKPGG